MRKSLLALLVAPALLGASHSYALNLCARIDKATGEPRDGASIKLRVQCRAGETAIGNTEEFAMIRENRTDIDTNSDAIDAALGGSGPAQIAAVQPATTAIASSGCGLTVTAGNAVFNACNVRVQSGEGRTDAINGLGNLIVGYDESPGNDKTGSHNLVVGMWHNYSAYGGLVAGLGNTITGGWTSVSGGYGNTASGNNSSVSGGGYNTADGKNSSVSGGRDNTAGGNYSSVSGGGGEVDGNFASARYSSISGGSLNTANGSASSVSGGSNNVAGVLGCVNFPPEYCGQAASVSGGLQNTASGDHSSVTGGLSNTANGGTSSVHGGVGNTSEGGYSAILGGFSQATPASGMIPAYHTIPPIP